MLSYHPRLARGKLSRQLFKLLRVRTLPADPRRCTLAFDSRIWPDAYGVEGRRGSGEEALEVSLGFENT